MCFCSQHTTLATGSRPARKWRLSTRHARHTAYSILDSVRHGLYERELLMKSMTLLNSTSRLFVLVVLATLLAIAPQLGRPRPAAAATPMAITFTVNTNFDS